MIAFSPSNLSQFKLCPLKFYGQSIVKTIKWKETPQKKRGLDIHEALAKATQKGFDAVTQWPAGLDTSFIQTVVGKLAFARDNFNVELMAEHKMAITARMKPCDWWADDCFLRAMADVIALHRGEWALVGDWKTGKIYPDMDFQLRVESVLLHVLYGVKKVSWALWYVDSGQKKSGTVDFTRGLGDVMDILQLMQEARAACASNVFLPRKNQFCRWCDWYNTENCTL